MNITVDKQLAECAATLRAEIPADKAKDERKKIVQAFGSQAKIPGFRPGKIPQTVIEKRFGNDIKQELEQRLVSAACHEAIQNDVPVEAAEKKQRLDQDVEPLASELTPEQVLEKAKKMSERVSAMPEATAEG